MIVNTSPQPSAQAACPLRIARAALNSRPRTTAAAHHLLFVAFLLLLWNPVQASLPAALSKSLQAETAAAYRVRQIGPFRLYYHPADQTFAETSVIVIEQSRSHLAERFGLSNFRNARVVIAFDAVHFQALAGSAFPHWGAACALPSKRQILLKSPRFSRNREHPGSTIRHEMAHLAVGILCRDKRPPVWLNEGIAVIESGLPMQPGQQGTSLSSALLTGNLLSLDDMESLHGYNSGDADLAYREAENATRYFLERFGHLALVQLLTEVGRGRAFPEAFDLVTGGAWFRFESDWEDHLDERMGFYFLVDAISWFWLLIFPLGGFAIWVRRRKSKKILEKWADEIVEEDLD
jgi:hypothetical protein